MNLILTIIQIVIALSIYNVWLLRYNKSTPWRAGSAENIREEFIEYGLPAWFRVTVTVLKLSFATLLLTGVFYYPLTKPAAAGMAILMLGAVFMHLKVKDPIKKALPATTLLILSLSLIII